LWIHERQQGVVAEIGSDHEQLDIHRRKIAAD
jgi:hypothetical protein